MNKSPNVILKMQFVKPIKSNSIAFNKVKGMFNYFSKEEKRVMTMFDYYNGTIKKSGKKNLVIENGSYASKEEIEKRKNIYLKYVKNSNLWKGVISFNNDYIDSNIDIKDLEQIIIKKIFPKFFKELGFIDNKKMSYQLAFHNDTDNYHFHFSFIEKEPNYLGRNNKVCYRKKGIISDREQNFLKNMIVLEISRKKEFGNLVKSTNIEIENLKKYFKPNTYNYILNDKNDLKLEEKISYLGKLLSDKRNNDQRIKFNSINDKEIINLTKEIANNILDKNEIKNNYKNFKKSLDDINDLYKKISIMNNSETNIDIYSTKKDKYMNNYIYNAIVNNALYESKKKKKKQITKNDLIRSVIYTTNLKDNTNYNIVSKYLSTGKLINNYAIKNAIKNIDNEMEEATNEFHKLFNNVKDYN